MHNQIRIKKMQGLSLIELMVSMVISLFLIGGLASVYISTRASDKMRVEISEMEENARTALLAIRNIVSHAGYPSIYNHTIDEPFYAGADNIPNPDCRAGGAKESLIAYTPILDEKTEDSTTGKRDTLVTVFMADNPDMVGAPPGLLTQDCMASTITAQCSSDPMGGMYNPTESKIYNYLYITTNNGRRALTCMGSLGGAQPIAENIENMQFLYGVLVGDDLIYKNATEVTADGDWGSVINVQAGILVRSEREVLDTDEKKVFLLLDQKITTAKDRRIYKAYTTTIVLPNRITKEL